MIYAKKIEIVFDANDTHILDGQSKLRNWLYNQLLQVSIEDYKNGNKNKLLSYVSNKEINFMLFLQLKKKISLRKK